VEQIIYSLGFFKTSDTQAIAGRGKGKTISSFEKHALNGGIACIDVEQQRNAGAMTITEGEPLLARQTVFQSIKRARNKLVGEITEQHDYFKGQAEAYLGVVARALDRLVAQREAAARTRKRG
jgi:hypothetical protein